MAQTKRPPRSPGATFATSNTGPLIFAFQSDSVSLLTTIFAELHLPEACAKELVAHGWQDEFAAAGDSLVILKLTPKEVRKARTLARQIAEQTGGGEAASHLGEAQAIVLALRREYHDDVLVLDERAARAVARQQGLTISGFPGMLLLAVQGGLISATDLKDRLEVCRKRARTMGRTSSNRCMI